MRVTGGGPGVPDGTRPAVLYLVAPARPGVDQRRGDPPAAPLAGRRLRGRSRDHQPARHHRAVVRAGGQPRRLRADLRARPPALAQERGRQRRATGRSASEDGVDINRNFPDHWAHAPQGSSTSPRRPDLPGPGAGLGAGDQGRSSPWRPGAVPVRGQLPLLRAAAPVPDRLAGADADGRPAHLRGPGRHAGQPGHPRATSRSCRPTSTPPTGRRRAGPTPTPGPWPSPSSWARACPGSGFVFPDNEALVEQEYQLNRPFALDVARSAADPADPVSHLGNRVAAVRGRRVRRLLRRSAAGAGDRPPPARAGDGALAGRATGPSGRPRPSSGPAACGTAAPATSTPAGCGARSPAPGRATP